MKRILFFTLLALPLSAQSANFDVAHLREQGQDMIIFPMDSSIDYKSDVETGNNVCTSTVCK